MKNLTSREVAVLKRIAQNNYPLSVQVEKIDKQIEALVEEKKTKLEMLDRMEVGAIAMTGGYTSSQLIERVVLPAVDANGNQKVDKAGKPLTITRFVPKEGALVELSDGSFQIVENEGGELVSEQSPVEEA